MHENCLHGLRQGMQLQEAEALVKGKRSQAHPYIDCWRVGHALKKPANLLQDQNVSELHVLLDYERSHVQSSGHTACQRLHSDL